MTAATTTTRTPDPLLQIDALRVEFGPAASPLVAVDDLALHVDEGEVVGVVGESGSGKSVAALATMGLVDPPARIAARRLRFAGVDLLAVGERERRALVGKDLAMIFQDPLASLNPCFTVAFQLTEVLRAHGSSAERASARARRERALQLLRQVGIADAEARLDAYPHQLSGGMAQRVMIAMAVACRPRLLIADEPTTALDVTVQAQILDLLMQLQARERMAMILISHDLALVAQAAHRVVVMYAGRIVEAGPAAALFDAPRHPYTRALLDALPEHNVGRARLQALPGVVPGRDDRPRGCLLSPRCAHAVQRCRDVDPAVLCADGREVRCQFPLARPGANDA